MPGEERPSSTLNAQRSTHPTTGKRRTGKAKGRAVTRGQDKTTGKVQCCWGKRQTVLNAILPLLPTIHQTPPHEQRGGSIVVASKGYPTQTCSDGGRIETLAVPTRTVVTSRSHGGSPGTRQAPHRTMTSQPNRPCEPDSSATTLASDTKALNHSAARGKAPRYHRRRGGRGIEEPRRQREAATRHHHKPLAPQKGWQPVAAAAASPTRTHRAPVLVGVGGQRRTARRPPHLPSQIPPTETAIRNHPTTATRGQPAWALLHRSRRRRNTPRSRPLAGLAHFNAPPRPAHRKGGCGHPAPKATPVRKGLGPVHIFLHRRSCRTLTTIPKSGGHRRAA